MTRLKRMAAQLHVCVSSMNLLCEPLWDVLVRGVALAVYEEANKQFSCKSA